MFNFYSKFSQGKSLADVSQYFYICCTFSESKSEKTKEDGNYLLNQDGEKSRNIESPASIIKKSAAIPREEDPLEHKTGEGSREERRAKRVSLDLSHLEEDNKQEISDESDRLLRTKSAPIVTLHELDELL